MRAAVREHLIEALVGLLVVAQAYLFPGVVPGQP